MATPRNRKQVTVTLPQFMREWLKNRVDAGQSPSMSDDIERGVAALMILEQEKEKGLERDYAVIQ